MLINVVFVCKENICRSALAEFCLRQYITDIIGQEQTDKYFLIQSAGLQPCRGRWKCRLLKKMREVAAFFGMQNVVNNHRSKPLTDEILNAGTDKYVYCMNQQTIDLAKKQFPNGAYNLFYKDKNMPEDPYGKRTIEYAGCVILIKNRCKVLADAFVSHYRNLKIIS